MCGGLREKHKCRDWSSAAWRVQVWGPVMVAWITGWRSSQAARARGVARAAAADELSASKTPAVWGQHRAASTGARGRDVAGGA